MYEQRRCVHHACPTGFASLCTGSICMSPEHRLPEPTMCGAQQVSKWVQVSVFHLQLSRGSGDAWKSRKATISVQTRICCFERNQWHSRKHKMKKTTQQQKIHPLLSFLPSKENTYTKNDDTEGNNKKKGPTHISFSFQSCLIHLWPMVESGGRMCAWNFKSLFYVVIPWFW